MSTTDGLVGYTGFVGGNLMAQHEFGGRFNRANVGDLAGASFDSLVISAVPATMWLANKNPDADRANILELFEHLRSARAGHAVLISTIAVYRDPATAPDEDSDDYETTLAYGRHRREFETLVAEAFPSHLILRLPALFGRDLKKNFLFDLMNPVPSFLKPDLFETLRDADAGLVERFFAWDDAAGMWKFDRDGATAAGEKAALEAICAAADISALAFTHADSRFQFYDLSRLWADIARAREAGIRVLNLATEPMAAGEIFQAVTGGEMAHRSAGLVTQDLRSRHAPVFGRNDGYLAGRDEVLTGIRALVEANA